MFLLGVLGLAGCASTPKVGPGVERIQPAFVWPEGLALRAVGEGAVEDPPDPPMVFRAERADAGWLVTATAEPGEDGEMMIPEMAEGFATLTLGPKGRMEALRLAPKIQEIADGLAKLGAAAGETGDEDAEKVGAFTGRFGSMLARLFEFLTQAVEYIWWLSVDQWVNRPLVLGEKSRVTVSTADLPGLLHTVPAAEVTIERTFEDWIACEPGDPLRRCARLSSVIEMDEATRERVRAEIEATSETPEMDLRLFDAVWTQTAGRATVITDPLTLRPYRVEMPAPGRDEPQGLRFEAVPAPADSAR